MSLQQFKQPVFTFNAFISNDTFFKWKISWPKALVVLPGTSVTRDIVCISSGCTHLSNKSAEYQLRAHCAGCWDHRDENTHFIGEEEKLREIKQFAQGHQAHKWQSWTPGLFPCHRSFTKQLLLPIKNDVYMNAQLECTHIMVLLLLTLSFFLSYPCITVTLFTLTIFPTLCAFAAQNILNSFMKCATFYLLRCWAYRILQLKESHWAFQPFKVTAQIMHSCYPLTLAKSWGQGESRCSKVAQERREEAAVSLHLPEPIPPDGTCADRRRPVVMLSMGLLSDSQHQIQCLQAKS